MNNTLVEQFEAVLVFVQSAFDEGGTAHEVEKGLWEWILRDCLATRHINPIVNQAPLCTAFDYYRPAEEVSDKRRDILVPCSRMVYVRNLY
jgi:hypothetical protein